MIKPNERKTRNHRGRRSPIRRNAAGQRQRLKDAAIKLFATRGFHGSTVRQIAARVNLQAGALYYYFPSKQDLLREICLDTILRDRATVETILATVEDPIDGLAALLRAGIESEIARPEPYVVLRSETRALKKNQRAVVAEALRNHRGNWVTIIQRGVSNGLFDCPDPRTAAVILAQLEDVGGWYSPTGRLTKDELIDQLTRLALGMLGHKCSAGCTGRVCSDLFSMRAVAATGLSRDGGAMDG